jgi:hypothetical protein
MSLMKSKRDKSQPEAAESGSPDRSSLPIAYAVKRKASAPKKMSQGGMAADSASQMPDMKENYSDADEHYGNIADAILAKKKRMSDGGMVDMDANSEEHPNGYYPLNEDAADADQYDLDQLSADPMDSNEHGDEIESDKHDFIEEVRRKMAAKRRK